MSWMPYVAQPYWVQPPIITPIITNGGRYNQVQSLLGTVPYPNVYFDPGAFQSAGMIHDYSRQFFSQLLPPVYAGQMAMQSTANFRPPLHPPLVAREIRSDPQEGSQPSITAREMASAEQPPLVASNQELEVQSDPEEDSQPSITARETVLAEGHQAKTKTGWFDKDSAKLIRLKAQNSKHTVEKLLLRMGAGYSLSQIRYQITCLYSKYRQDKESLKKYVGQEGLTEEVLKTFIDRIPKQRVYSKRVKWSDKDSAKLIRLKVENPGKMYRDLSLEFTVQYDERRIGNRLSNLYQEYRKNENSLEKYVGKAGLTKGVLTKFIERIRTDVSSENWAEWSDNDIAKLIKLRVEKSNETYHGLSKEFAGKYDEIETGSRLVRLYNQYRKNENSLEKYVGQEGLTKDHLERFIEMIPESKPYQKTKKWSEKDTIKLIKLRANDPERPHLALVNEFKGRYTGKQIDHRLLTLYRKHRINNALRNYLEKAGLTEALIEKFTNTIPKGKKSKHLTS